MTKDANAHAHDPDIKKESTDSDQTFAQRIFAKILRNLQLYIRRIHIRYEDDKIDPDVRHTNFYLTELISNFISDHFQLVLRLHKLNEKMKAVKLTNTRRLFPKLLD